MFDYNELIYAIKCFILKLLKRIIIIFELTKLLKLSERQTTFYRFRKVY